MPGAPSLPFPFPPFPAQIVDPGERLEALRVDYWQLRAEFVPEDQLPEAMGPKDYIMQVRARALGAGVAVGVGVAMCGVGRGGGGRAGSCVAGRGHEGTCGLFSGLLDAEGQALGRQPPEGCVTPHHTAAPHGNTRLSCVCTCVQVVHHLPPPLSARAAAAWAAATATTAASDAAEPMDADGGPDTGADAANDDNDNADAEDVDAPDSQGEQGKRAGPKSAEEVLKDALAENMPGAAFGDPLLIRVTESDTLAKIRARLQVRD